MAIGKRKILLAILYASPILWFLAVIWTINTTSPLAIGPAGILAVFILFYGLASSTLFVLGSVANKLSTVIGRRQILSTRRMYYMTSILAFGPVFMIALNTLGQLGAIEVTLVIMLIALGMFYTLRRTA